jgi:hypothetical protein
MLQLHYNRTVPQIRTETEQVLGLLPLPLGYYGLLFGATFSFPRKKIGAQQKLQAKYMGLEPMA